MALCDGTLTRPAIVQPSSSSVLSPKDRAGSVPGLLITHAITCAEDGAPLDIISSVSFLDNFILEPVAYTAD